MPETIRTANEKLHSRPRRGGFLAAFFLATPCMALSMPARAGAAGLIDNILSTGTAVSRQQVAALTLTLALLCFAVLAIIVLMRTRRAAATVETAARDENIALRAEIDRLKTLLLSEPQVLVTWAAGTDEPEFFGDTGIVVPGGVPERVLAFGAWLEAAAAQRMQHAVETLRGNGHGFTMTLTTRAGRPLEADGRAVAGRAVLRLRDISGIELELMDLAARHDRLTGDVEIMKALLNSLPAPVWARDPHGRLIFVNAAYARAVEADDPTDAVARELELLDHTARESLARARAGGGSLFQAAAGRRRRHTAASSTWWTRRAAPAAPAWRSTPPRWRPCAPNSRA